MDIGVKIAHNFNLIACFRVLNLACPLVSWVCGSHLSVDGGGWVKAHCKINRKDGLGTFQRGG